MVVLNDKKLKSIILQSDGKMRTMVHCTKCGAENQDDAKFCVKCGATLSLERRAPMREDECFGPRKQEDECFGIPHAGAVVGIVIGLIIVILGVASFYRIDVGPYLGPFVLIVIGLLIAIGAAIGLSRRRPRY